MNIVLVYGSVRTQREGIKAVRFFQKVLEKRGNHVAVIDPLKEQLPLLDRMYK